jgi:hypothetical protein
LVVWKLLKSKIDCSTIVNPLGFGRRGHARLTIDEQGLLIVEVELASALHAGKYSRVAGVFGNF